MTIRHNKLVRDKIPDIIQQAGRIPTTHIATSEEYQQKLRKKLGEEVDEFLQSGSAEELADILEVIYALGKLSGTSPEQLERIRQKKATERGGFKEKVILEKVD